MKKLFIIGLVFFIPGLAFAFNLASLRESFLANILRLAAGGSNCSDIKDASGCAAAYGCQWTSFNNPSSIDVLVDCSEADCNRGLAGCSWQDTKGEWYSSIFNFGEDPSLTEIISGKQCVGQKLKSQSQVGFCSAKSGIPVAPTIKNPLAPAAPLPAGNNPAPPAKLNCEASTSCSPPCVKLGSQCKNPKSETDNVSSRFLKSQNIPLDAAPQSSKAKCEGLYGTTYQVGAVAIGGKSGYSICGNNGWKPCPECKITDLTVVPEPYVKEYNKAVSKGTNDAGSSGNPASPKSEAGKKEENSFKLFFRGVQKGIKTILRI